MLVHDAATRKVSVEVVSPLAGGISVTAVEFDAWRGTDRCQAQQQLKVGIMNPGKTGFSNLHSTDILWWRWWEVGFACQELGLQLVALPGPRIPPGIKLLDGF